MAIVYACICPPTADPDAPRTVEALEGVEAELRAHLAELTVVISREGTVLPRAIQVATGHDDRSRRVAALLRDELPRDAVPFRVALESGSPPSVPLSEGLGSAGWLSVQVASLSLREHLEIGRALGRALAGDEPRTALVCVAALASTGDERRARQFDRQYRRAIEEWDVKWLTNIDAAFRRSASESAVAQTAVLMGALSGCRIQPRVVSCGRADGEGWMIAAIDVAGPRRDREKHPEPSARRR
jgi:hypothetical protein